MASFYLHNQSFHLKENKATAKSCWLIPMPTVPLLTTTGQTWDGSNCTGSPSGMSWNNGNVISIPTGYTSSVTCKRNSFNLSGLSDAASTYSKLKFEIAQLNASV